MNAREIHYKLFGDELDDTIDAFIYPMFTPRIKQSTWKRIECKGIEDNNGFWELSVTPASQDKE